MAATYKVQYGVGGDASPTWTDLPGGGGTSFRFKTNTDVVANLNNPIPIPNSGFNYAFWVSLSLNMTGTYTQIDNIRHYCDGTINWTLGIGGGIFVNSVPAGLGDAQYEQSQGTIDVSGDELQSGHSVISAVVNIETYTAGSPQVVDAGPYTTAPDQSDHICIQPKVDTAANGAVQGIQPSETLVFLVDEI